MKKKMMMNFLYTQKFQHMFGTHFVSCESKCFEFINWIFLYWMERRRMMMKIQRAMDWGKRAHDRELMRVQKMLWAGWRWRRYKLLLKRQLARYFFIPAVIKFFAILPALWNREAFLFCFIEQCAPNSYWVIKKIQLNNEMTFN